jgi:thiol-disulfide isomerase/thioredoxin
MRKLCILLFTVLHVVSFQAQVKIIGIAPEFTGKTFSAWRIDDFLNNHKTLIQTYTVDTMGIFRFTLPLDKIEKVIIGTDAFNGFLYTQPNAKYNLEFLSDNPQNLSYNLKEEIELTFFDLDSNDINFKILGFESWLDSYLGEIYVEKDVHSTDFIRKIALMKLSVNSDYQKDTSTYFKDFITYTMAMNVDNLRYIGAPSNTDKYRIYLENVPVRYNNDTYMTYFKTFYDQFIYQLDAATTNQIFALLAGNELEKCDQLLSKQPYCSNTELRSMVLLFILKQAIADNFIPKSVIASNLKQFTARCPFNNQQLMAKNILGSMNQIQIGNEFLNLEINTPTGIFKLNKTIGKTLYIHAFNPSNTNCISELGALKKLQKTYGANIEFVTFYVDKPNLSETEKRNLNAITWKKVGLTIEDPLWTNMGIFTFPFYMLIDTEYIVQASPALSPSPNGTYETIEKTFFELGRP